MVRCLTGFQQLEDEKLGAITRTFGRIGIRTIADLPRSALSLLEVTRKLDRIRGLDMNTRDWCFKWIQLIERSSDRPGGG